MSTRGCIVVVIKVLVAGLENSSIDWGSEVENLTWGKRV